VTQCFLIRRFITSILFQIYDVHYLDEDYTILTNVVLIYKVQLEHMLWVSILVLKDLPIKYD
jgi:hypothetical protein